MRYQESEKAIDCSIDAKAEAAFTSGLKDILDQTTSDDGDLLLKGLDMRQKIDMAFQVLADRLRPFEIQFGVTQSVESLFAIANDTPPLAAADNYRREPLDADEGI